MKDFLIYSLLVFILFSCKKEEDNGEPITPSVANASISGKAHKGPFQTGSDVVINELNSNLEETGISYSTTVYDDAGSYSLNDISISTSIASVTVSGYFYMEAFDFIAPHKMYLEAIGDVQGVSTINVNLLTHLIKPRMEKLVSNGTPFSAARNQAQNELRTYLHSPLTDTTNFEDMSVTNNSFVFAVSLIFQRRIFGYVPGYNYVYELNDLVNRFRSDFKDNGLIDSDGITDTLLYNANRIELIDDRLNFEDYMSTIGQQVSVTGYEQHVYNFQKANSSQIYSNYYFPDSIPYALDNNPPSMCPNILLDTAVNFLGGNIQYIMSAIVPFDSSLTIQFTQLSQTTQIYSVSTYYYYGWTYSGFTNGFTLEAQRKNYLNAMMVWLWGSPDLDSARVEYFKNNQPAPFISKVIYW